MELNGSADSTSKHDNEHVISSKTVGKMASGADAVLTLLSGEYLW